MFVKGSTIRSKLEYVEGNHGKDARKVLEEMISALGVSLPIMDMSWYPYEAYIELLNALANKHLGGDIRRLASLGSESADMALGTIYKPYVRDSGFEEFALDLPRLHGLFYSNGAMDVAYDTDAKSCTITHHNQETFDEADVHLATGFYVRAAEIHGLEDLSTSVFRDRERVVIKLKWTWNSNYSI